MARPLRPIVLLVDDHPLVVDALRLEVERHGEFRVQTAASLGEGREALRRFDPNVLVCDVRLPDGNGLKLIEEVRAANRGTACLVLSSFDSRQYVAAAQRLGAAGFLLKTETTAAIMAAIRTVAAGGRAFEVPEASSVESPTLSDRDRDLVAGVVAGKTNHEIAGYLGITRKGVEAHLSRIYERAGVSSRTELAVRAAREGWLEDA